MAKRHVIYIPKIEKSWFFLHFNMGILHVKYKNLLLHHQLGLSKTQKKYPKLWGRGGIKEKETKIKENSNCL